MKYVRAAGRSWGLDDAFGSGSLNHGGSPEIVRAKTRYENASDSYSIRGVARYLRSGALGAYLSLLGLGATALSGCGSDKGNGNDCSRAPTQALAGPSCPPPPPPPPPPAVDVCPNLQGDQPTIPDGYEKDAEGNCVLKQTAVSGFARRILRGDGGNSIISFDETPDVDGAAKFSFNANGSGDYSGNVTRNKSYNISVTGDHRGASLSNRLLNEPSYVFSFWMIDNDDNDPNSRWHFNLGEFNAAAYRPDGGLRRMNGNPKLRIYTANWDQGTIGASREDIFRTIESASREAVSALTRGRMIQLNLNDIEYVEGTRAEDAPIPNNRMFDFFTSFNGTAGEADQNHDGYEIIGGYAKFNVRRIESLTALKEGLQHEWFHNLGFFGHQANTVMSLSCPCPLNFKSINNGTYMYSTPIGTRK